MSEQQLTINELTTNFQSLKNTQVFLTGYISKCELALKKDKTSSYLTCSIGDVTGEVSAKLWQEEQSKQIISQLEEAGRKSAAISIQATVKEWNGKADLAIDSYKLDVNKPLLDLVEKVKGKPQEIFNRLKILIDSVQKEEYKILLKGLFDNTFVFASEEIKKKIEQIRKDFYYSAAATGHHHNYLHGLIEHTVNVVETAIFLAKRYENIYEVDMDLLITGGILHDIGKIYEYSYQEGIEYSEEGPYAYHTVTGCILVNELNVELGIHMSRKDQMRLWHLISSHHGEYSEHAPNDTCPEAHILSFADIADSQTNKVMRGAASGQLKRMKTRIS